MARGYPTKRVKTRTATPGDFQERGPDPQQVLYEGLMELWDLLSKSTRVPEYLLPRLGGLVAAGYAWNAAQALLEHYMANYGDDLSFQERFESYELSESVPGEWVKREPDVAVPVLNQFGEQLWTVSAAGGWNQVCHTGQSVTHGRAQTAQIGTPLCGATGQVMSGFTALPVIPGPAQRGIRYMQHTHNIGGDPSLRRGAEIAEYSCPSPNSTSPPPAIAQVVDVIPGERRAVPPVASPFPQEHIRVGAEPHRATADRRAAANSTARGATPDWAEPWHRGRQAPPAIVITVPGRRGQKGTMTRAPARAASPPRPGEKEQKVVAAPNQAWFIMKLFNRVTEMTEVVDCLYHNLPNKAKLKWPNGRPKRAIFLQDKVGKVAENWGQVDTAAFIACVAFNQLEDWLYGAFGGSNADLNRMAGVPVGLQTVIHAMTDAGLIKDGQLVEGLRDALKQVKGELVPTPKKSSRRAPVRDVALDRYFRG